MLSYVMVGLVVLVVSASILLRHRVVREMPGDWEAGAESPPAPAPPFPPHVRIRGFSTCDFQESGGYASDAVVGGKLTHFPGALTDWSWDVAKDASVSPPHWARDDLPSLFSSGNGTTAERLSEDVRSMRRCGANAARFSLSWAKLQPSGPSTPLAPEEVARTRARIETYRSAGLVCVVPTLLHFVLPRWFPGWNEEGEAAFSNFVFQVGLALPSVADERGQEWWVTINEPNIHVIHSYLIATRPPGERSLPAAMEAYASMLRCHVIAERELRRARKGVALHASPACNIILFEPSSALNPIECIVASAVDALFNRSVLSLLCRGHAYVGRTRVQGAAASAASPPFVAVNQYTRVVVRWDSLRSAPDFEHELPASPLPGSVKNDLNWDVHPRWFAATLRSVHRFCPSARVVITEHGIPDEGDEGRCSLLRTVSRALGSMPFVVGYMHWTFADNVEWELGTGARFGVCSTDFETFERKGRPSLRLLGRMWSGGA